LIPLDLVLPGGPRCPWATADLPAIGGHVRRDPEDFVVDEIPAYPPSGEGDHWFVRVRKRGIETWEAQELLAAAVGLSPRDVGFAGRKDKHAIATQWFSLPAEPVDPGDPRLELLESARHPHKLRIGHVRANHFRIRLRDVTPDNAERLPALRARLEAGVPNYFGPQRFGTGERALADAERLLRRQRVRDPRFSASVVQAAVFNRWLGDRVADGLLHRALPGDVLKKRETGGLFRCTEPDVDQARLDAGEIDPAGPMVGAKALAAADEAAAREAAAIEALGLTPDALRGIGRFAPGTRRVARIVPADLELTPDGPDLIVAFTLPSGSYATVVLGELAHPAADVRLLNE
jgi:tRNA pseudouridine13 synthase